MNEKKPILNYIRDLYPTMKKVLTDNWKPKYLCLLLAFVVWGILYYMVRRDDLSAEDWDPVESKPDNPIDENSRNTISPPTNNIILNAEKNKEK